MARQKQNRKRGGGPKSVTGKEASSQNSTRHGMRSMKVRLLGEETQEEYDEAVAGWRAQFEPADFQEEKLVDTLIRNDWMHRRAERWLLDSEASMVDAHGNDPMQWPGEERHKLELAQRYKTTAERAFYRSWTALNNLRKDVMRESDEKAKLRFENECFRVEKQMREEREAQKKGPEAKKEEAAPALTKAQQVFGGQKSKKKQKKIAILDQWIEIEVLPNGKTLTQLHPSNLPPSEERGGCDCPTCSHNRAILEAEAA